MNLSPSLVFFVFFLLSLLDYEVAGTTDILYEEKKVSTTDILQEFMELEKLLNEMLDAIARLQESVRCESDDVCGTGHCLLQAIVNEDGDGPSINYCYECVNNQDCDETKECTISSSTTDLECTTRHLLALPSIRGVLNGYDLYKGDPFLIKAMGNDDPGVLARPFFAEIYDETESIILQDNRRYYSVVGFTVLTSNYEKREVTVEIISSTHDYAKATGVSVSVGGDGSYEGVDLGGNVGVESTSELRQRAHDAKTSVFAYAMKHLYKFSIDRSKLQPLPEALSIIEGSSPNWSLFFKLYGTHITTSGVVGAQENVSLEYNEKDRAEFSKDGGTFESGLSLGIPGVFNVGTKTKETSEITDEKELTSRSLTHKSVKLGVIENILDESAIIQRTLLPICDFLDSSMKTSCQRELARYCVSVFNSIGDNTNKCSAEHYYSFDCVTPDDCAQNEFCNWYTHKCVKDNGDGWQSGKTLHIESKKWPGWFLTANKDASVSISNSHFRADGNWVPAYRGVAKDGNGVWELESVMFPNHFLSHGGHDGYVMLHTGLDYTHTTTRWKYFAHVENGRTKYSILSYSIGVYDGYIDASDHKRPYVKNSLPNKYSYRDWYFTNTKFWL